MPGSELLQAIDHLDQALSRAEKALDSHLAGGRTPSATKDKTVRAAMAELDALIASLGGDKNG